MIHTRLKVEGGVASGEDWEQGLLGGQDSKCLTPKLPTGNSHPSDKLFVLMCQLTKPGQINMFIYILDQTQQRFFPLPLYSWIFIFFILGKWAEMFIAFNLFLLGFWRGNINCIPKEHKNIDKWHSLIQQWVVRISPKSEQELDPCCGRCVSKTNDHPWNS